MKLIQSFLALSLAGFTTMTASVTANDQPKVRGHSRKATLKGVRNANAVLHPTQRILKKDDSGDDTGGIDVDEILGFGCFSEVATAEVQYRGPVAMKDLQVGDKVLTGSKEYQPIYAFGHKSVDAIAEFRQVHTKETVMELTGEHLVYLKDKVQPVRADSLQVGDSLLGKDGNGQSITKIGTIQRRGLYAPFTPEGTVLVDGIAASSYISVQDGKTYLEMNNGLQLPLSQHGYVHMGMSPLRLLCMGVSSHYCGSNEHYNDQGLPSYVAWALDTSLWANDQPPVIQAFIFMTFLLVYVPILVVETLFGPSLAPLAIFALASLIYWRKKIPNQKQKAL